MHTSLIWFTIYNSFLVLASCQQLHLSCLLFEIDFSPIWKNENPSDHLRHLEVADKYDLLKEGEELNKNKKNKSQNKILLILCTSLWLIVSCNLIIQVLITWT